MQKKAIELSVNFIVTIIIAIVLLSLGILLLRQFIGGAKEIKAGLDARTEAQLADLLEAGQQVAISFSRAEVRRGQQHIFGIGILNVEEEKKFYLNIDLSKAIDKTKKDITKDVQDLWTNAVLYNPGPYHIEQNKQHKEAILIKVPKEAPSGTYIFNVEVTYGTTIYDNIKKIYITVP